MLLVQTFDSLSPLSTIGHRKRLRMATFRQNRSFRADTSRQRSLEKPERTKKPGAAAARPDTCQTRRGRGPQRRPPPRTANWYRSRPSMDHPRRIRYHWPPTRRPAKTGQRTVVRAATNASADCGTTPQPIRASGRSSSRERSAARNERQWPAVTRRCAVAGRRLGDTSGRRSEEAAVLRRPPGAAVVRQDRRQPLDRRRQTLERRTRTAAGGRRQQRPQPPAGRRPSPKRDCSRLVRASSLAFATWRVGSGTTPEQIDAHGDKLVCGMKHRVFFASKTTEQE